MPFDWGQFLQNNAGNFVNAGGAYLNSRANNNQNREDTAATLAQRERERQDQMRQFLLSLAQRGGEFDRQLSQSRYETDQGNRLRRDETGVEATQLDPYAQQRSRQQQAMMAALLPGARNVSVSSNIPGMNQFIPQVSGGMRIPEGGFGRDVLDFFSPESRANAEGAYWNNAAPFADPPDLSGVGYGNAGRAPTQRAQQARQTFLGQQRTDQAKNQADDESARARQQAMMDAFQTQMPSATTSSPQPGQSTSPSGGGRGRTAATIGLTAASILGPWLLSRYGGGNALSGIGRSTGGLI